MFLHILLLKPHQLTLLLLMALFHFQTHFIILVSDHLNKIEVILLLNSVLRLDPIHMSVLNVIRQSESFQILPLLKFLSKRSF